MTRPLFKALERAPFAAWVVVILWALGFGFVGLRQGHAPLLARLLPAGTLAAPESPNPLLETLWKSLLHLAPGHISWFFLWGTNILGLMLTLWVLFGFLKRETRAPWAAHLGTVFVALHPWTVGECSTLGGTFIATAGMLGLVRAAEIKRWWATPLVWGLGGALLACWPPMLLWAAMLWLTGLAISSQPGGTASRGTMRAPWMPLWLLGAPVCVPLVAHGINPVVWGDPKARWLQLLEAAWLPELHGAWWQGAWWPDGHLSWWSGIPLIATATGVIALGLVVIGGLWTKRSLASWVPLLGLASVVVLCWVLPQGVSGVVDGAAMVPLWVGWLVARSSARLRDMVLESWTPRLKACVISAALLLPLALATLSHGAYASSWRSVFGAALSEGQDLLARDTILPFALLTHAGPSSPSSIWAPSPLREQIEAAIQVRPGLNLTEQPQANLWIERVVPSAPEDAVAVELTGFVSAKSVVMAGPGSVVFYRVVVP